MNKLLIFIPSPRNDPEFAERVAKLPHDKFWIKYHSYDLKPYQKARDFFLKHKQYSHFAICPDDLMVTEDGVVKLWKLAQKLDVIMGTCNVDMTDMDRLAMTSNLPDGRRESRAYDYIDRNEVNGKVIQVPWCGTPFAIFKRKIFKHVFFQGDRKWNPGRTAFSYDVSIAHDLKAVKIAINVDTSVFFKHKRHEFPILCGKEDPTWWWDRVGKGRIHDPDASWASMDKLMEIFMADNGFARTSANEAFCKMYELIKTLRQQNSPIN